MGGKTNEAIAFCAALTGRNTNTFLLRPAQNFAGTGCVRALDPVGDLELANCHNSFSRA
ncbi:MAG TPA: hypothetical protein VFZ04_07835 [Longimicrobiales bacterium]